MATVIVRGMCSYDLLTCFLSLTVAAVREVIIEANLVESTLL